MSDAGRVLQVLSERRYPMTIDVLAREARLSRRDTEAAIEALRFEGEPVVAGNEGVELTRDPRKVREYVASRRRRTLTVALGTRAMLRTARRLEDEQRRIERPGFWDAA